jgi:hypothetical protein
MLFGFSIGMTLMAGDLGGSATPKQELRKPRI